VAFITSQGVPKKYGSNRRELPISAIDALKRYFSNHPKVNADFRGAVVVVFAAQAGPSPPESQARRVHCCVWHARPLRNPTSNNTIATTNKTWMNAPIE
jgi:hypothetical protein